MRKVFGAHEGERGFTLLGVLLAVLIVGVMATIAVPRFTSALAAANTAKIQADLSTIDTAAALYLIDKGAEPTTINDLKDYLENFDKVKPPTGSCTINGSRVDVPAEAYTLTKGDDSRMHATLGQYDVYDFGGKAAAADTAEKTS